MSLLMYIWFASFLAMVGIVLHGRRSRSKTELLDIRLSDFASHEAHLLLTDVISFFHILRPHGVRALSRGLVFVRRGQDFIITNVYGKTKMHKGSASSFFLKQIAEQKEMESEKRAEDREV